jgi:hypothetical protein
MQRQASCSFQIIQRVPTGKENALIDIQRFIEERQWEFNSEELRKEVLQFISIESAVTEWLSEIGNPGYVQFAV